MDIPPPPDPAEEPKYSNTLLKVGTVIVIGAMAANVIGFRYSRWAVGKDVHRAWQNRERAEHARIARQKAERQRVEDQQRAGEQMRQQQHSASRQQKEGSERERVRDVFEEWERAFGGSNTGGYVHMDNRTLEQLFKRMGVGMRGFPGVGSGGMGAADDVIEELLRAAQAAERGRRGQGDGYESFRYWEQTEQQGGFGGREGVFGRDNRRHYDTLGVKANANEDEIKRAYLKEAMKWHPDRYRGEDKQGAEKRFREVAEAYEALKK